MKPLPLQKMACEAVLLSMCRFEGLLESIDILADPDMAAQLRVSAADVGEGRMVAPGEVFD